MRRVLIAALTFFICGLAGSGQVHADPDKRKASVLFKEGNRLYQRGLYLDALNKYKQARAIYPSAKIDLNIGSTLDALGKRAEAAAYFARFLLQKGNTSGKVVRQARRFFAALKKKVASVELTCAEAGATVRVDSAVLGITPLAVPVYLEPGEHRVKVHKEAVGEFARTLTLSAGQHIHLDASLARRPALVAPRPDPVAPPPASTPAGGAAPRPHAGTTSRTKTILAYSTLGLGAALAVGAAVMYGVGVTQGDEAHEAYGATRVQSEIDAHYEDVEAARTKLVVGHVLVGAAAAALGVSIYAFITRSSGQESQEKPRAGVSLSPGGGLSFSLSGQF